jgi:hypothetical protein
VVCLLLVFGDLALGSPALGAQLSPEQLGVLSAIARQQPIEHWPELTSVQFRELQTNVDAHLLNCRQHHLRNGLVADILFTGYDRGAVAKLDGVGDSATWTGHYLAALSLKFAVTKEDALLNEIDQALIALDVLTRVSGREGYIARYAGPCGDPAYEKYYRDYGAGPDPLRPGFGTWAYLGAGNDTNLVWLGSSSCDPYIGVNLGLATTFRLVEAGHRARVRALIELITDRLIQDRWLIDDGHGHITAATPSMVAAQLSTAVMVNPQKYQALYRQRAVLLGPPSPLNESEHYTSNNLTFITQYLLAVLETDLAQKAKYQQMMKTLWTQSSHHLNPWFAALYTCATGDTSNPIARATIQGVLFQFPEPPRWAKIIDNRTRPDIEVVGFGDNIRSKFALSIQVRPVSDFMWQRSPFELTGGSAVPLQYPGIDAFLPYWLARQSHGILR